MPAETGQALSGRPRGRRSGANNTRQAILDAARARFARDGYAAATIRKIASDAGVDAALVLQFFGSKDELFAAVLSITPYALARIADAFDGPAESVGERVARAYLSVWEGEPRHSEPLLAMLRSSIAHEQASAQLRDFIQARMMRAVNPRLKDDHDSVLRVGLASSMLVGVIVGRRIVGVPSLADEDADAIVAIVAPALQTILAGSPAAASVDAGAIAAGAGLAAPVASVGPVTLAAPGRSQDLQVRVSAPATGHGLPVILFSHGLASSMDDYAPLASFWAAHGFAVIQPAHLDSPGPASGVAHDPLTWCGRTDDLTRILDQLSTIDAKVPGLAGRIDPSRIAVAGHSWGALTASALGGARAIDADGTPRENLADPRIRAAVLLCLPGTGGDDLAPDAAHGHPFASPDFTELKTPSLVVAGDRDDSPLTARGPDWFTDGYRLSPGATDLLTLFDAEHWLGGIQGRHDVRTTDESPDRVELVQQITLAYLRTALGISSDAWPTAREVLTAARSPLGKIDSK
jgi:predicted dienelactone hydrolase/AcrR family transcriptional regulator